VLPYIPFFSNCYGFDSYIVWSALLEDENECQLNDYVQEGPIVRPGKRSSFPPLPALDNVYPVGPLDFFVAPVADTCMRTLTCQYEEQLATPDVTPRWMEMDDATEMYKILRNAVTWQELQTNGKLVIAQLATEGIDVEIAVMVDRTAAALELTGACTVGCFPRSVTLEITYYQIDIYLKRIIQATIILAGFDRDPTNNAYELTIEYYALRYGDLVIKFAFPQSFFIILFLVIGIVTVIAFMLFWAANRVMSLSRYGVNPPFSMTGYLALVVPPIFAGMCVGAVPLGLILAEITFLFKGWEYIVGPTAVDDLWLLDSIYNTYLLAKVDPTLVVATRGGRIGVSFLILGCYLLYIGAILFVPKKVSKRERDLDRARDARQIKRNIWTPTAWRRAHMILISIWLCFFLMIIVEISYWNEYGTYIYEFLVLYKVVAILVDIKVEGSLRDGLLVTPNSVGMSIIQGVVGLGATDFLDFVTGYAIDAIITMFESLYIGPLLDSAVEGTVEFVGTAGAALSARFSKKTLTIAEELEKEERDLMEAKAAEEAASKKTPGGDDGDREYLAKVKAGRDEKEKKGGKAAFRLEAAKKKKTKRLGGIKPRKRGKLFGKLADAGAVEDIIGAIQGYAAGAVGFVHQLIAIGLLILFRDETGIATTYGIKAADMLYYLLFALVMLPFQFPSDMFIHSAFESFHNFKFYEYLVYARYRFVKRETRWKGMEAALDECIEEGARTLDQMCFSSQFYFMIFMHSQGLYFFIMGQVIISNTAYNMFTDPALPVLIPLLLLSFYVTQVLCMRGAKFVGLWAIPDEGTGWHSTMGEGKDDKFGIPDMNQLDLIKKAAAAASGEGYIMNQKIGSETFRYKFLDHNRLWLVDRLPSVFTPRTLRRSRPYLIAQLAKILGAQAPEPDSDDEGLPEDLTQDYGPVSLTPSGRELIKWWLDSARRRLRFRASAAPILAAAKRAACELCQAPGIPPDRKNLTVEQMIPLDALADRFEHEADASQMDDGKWKTFFTKHQRFRTVCLACVAKRKAAKKATTSFDPPAKVHPAEGKGDPRFGPVFLQPATKAIISRWLAQARRRRAHDGAPAHGERDGRDRDEDPAANPEAPEWMRQPVRVNPASAALARKWLQTTRYQRSIRGQDAAEDVATTTTLVAAERAQAVQRELDGTRRVQAEARAVEANKESERAARQRIHPLVPPPPRPFMLAPGGRPPPSAQGRSSATAAAAAADLQGFPGPLGPRPPAPHGPEGYNKP